MYKLLFGKLNMPAVDSNETQQQAFTRDQPVWGHVTHVAVTISQGTDDI